MIERETWIRIIKDFEESDLPRVLIERDVPTDDHSTPSLVNLVKDMPIFRAVSIIGPRRIGKTYFMYQIIRSLIDSGISKSRILYLNLESDLLLGCDVKDLQNMLDIFHELHPETTKTKIYLFLDEIQNVPRWERFVRRLIDTRRIQVIISGSSSKILSREIATSLRGRTLTYPLYTFNFNEFLKTKGFEPTPYLSSSKKAQLLNLLARYLETSYPETLFLEREKDRILKEILDVTIYRDIIERHEVRNVKVLRLLLKGMAKSLYFSVNKFYNFLKSMGIKISKNTLYEYIEYFQEAMIIYPLKKFSPSYKNIERTMSKIYFIDNGLLQLFGTDDQGRLLENTVFIELLRRGWRINEQLFYHASTGYEVDFLIKKGNEVVKLIQVSHSMKEEGTKDRETKALAKASKELQCNDLLVITWDQEEILTKDGKKIKLKPLWKWLLNY